MLLSNPRPFGRFVPREEIGAAVSWDFGSVDPDEVAAAAALSAGDAARAAEQREAGYADGFNAGVAMAQELDNRQMAQFLRNTGEQAAAGLEAVTRQFGEEMEAARAGIAAQLLELACEVARQVVRSELTGRPEAIAQVVEEALSLLVDESAPRTVRLHPDDKALLESYTSGMPVALRADPSITRGGCLVECAGALVDATVEKRWMRAVANLGVSSEWTGEADERA